MSDKTDTEVKKRNKKKNEWTPGRILTTIIIAVLALLMVGGLYYFLVIIRQNTDDSTVYGYYNKEAVKYEPYNVFSETINGDTSFQTASEHEDSTQMIYSFYSAYQQQLIFQAVNQMAKKAGIGFSNDLVNKTIVDSGVYSTNGTGYDDEVYRNTRAQQRQVIRTFYEKNYPYTVVVEDIQTPNLTQVEKDVIGEIADNTRSFEYFVIDYHVYPDYLAQDYDISSMTKNIDEEGNEIEPTVDEIKEYIFQNEPELIKAYIDENVLASALSLAETNFEEAADIYSSGITTVENAAVNVSSSSYIYGVSARDSLGKLNSVYTEDLAKELHSAELGHVFSPIELSNSEGYLIVRVTAVRGDSLHSDLSASEETEQESETTEQTAEQEEPSYSSRSISEFLFEVNGALNIYGDMRNAVLGSEKHENLALPKIIDLVDKIIQNNRLLKNNSTNVSESSESSESTESTENTTSAENPINTEATTETTVEDDAEVITTAE